MDLLQRGSFTLHSGQSAWFKIDCDALSMEEIDIAAQIIVSHTMWWPCIWGSIRAVVGIPRGGLRLAEQVGLHLIRQDRLRPKEDGPTLIVDDVWTTGASMDKVRADTEGGVLGAVIFARSKPPLWIKPIFQMYDRVSS